MADAILGDTFTFPLATVGPVPIHESLPRLTALGPMSLRDAPAGVGGAQYVKICEVVLQSFRIAEADRLCRPDQEPARSAERSLKRRSNSAIIGVMALSGNGDTQLALISQRK